MGVDDTKVLQLALPSSLPAYSVTYCTVSEFSGETCNLQLLVKSQSAERARDKRQKGERRETEMWVQLLLVSLSFFQLGRLQTETSSEDTHNGE